MLSRTLEPEVMDTAEEAADYDAMDHSEVNRRFVDDLLAAWGGPLGDASFRLLDVGTGTALIPIELASRGFVGSITAIDLAEQMLAVGRGNVEAAGRDNIALERVDAKQLPYPNGTFSLVMSNSIVHHIPEPTSTFDEMRRVLRPDGLLFIRDLLRPQTADEVDHLVQTYAGAESPPQQQLFRQSLHAALSLEEIAELLDRADIDPTGLTQSSDRHWTLIWSKPPDE